uniref:Egg-white cystatin n=1 Tax=Gallus gallus TaxID=9031 RepID=A0A8V0Z7R5_CHICK
MAADFTRSFAMLCCLALWGSTCTCDATYTPPPHSTMNPGFPVPVNTNNPGVRKAARFGVYQFNNSSNDLFLFKEWQINKAMVQIVRGLKYMLHVEIGRTVCEKRGYSNLDDCHFQRKKNLQQAGAEHRRMLFSPPTPWPTILGTPSRQLKFVIHSLSICRY